MFFLERGETGFRLFKTGLKASRLENDGFLAMCRRQPTGDHLADGQFLGMAGQPGWEACLAVISLTFTDLDKNSDGTEIIPARTPAEVNDATETGASSSPGSV